VDRIKQQENNIGIKIASIGLGDSTWANAAALLDVGATTFIKDHINSYGTRMYGFGLSRTAFDSKTFY